MELSKQSEKQDDEWHSTPTPFCTPKIKGAPLHARAQFLRELFTPFNSGTVPKSVGNLSDGTRP